MSKEFINEYYIERKNTASLKWDGLKETYTQENLLPLWVADMDFKVPKAVQEALSERISHGVFGYSIVTDSYYEAFINFQKKRHNISLEKEWIRFSTGVVNSFNYIIQGFTEEKDSVLILAPVYYPFFDAVTKNNRQLVVSQLTNTKGHYDIDFEDFERKIVEEKVKLFLHCSPQNPVGRIWRQDELERLFEICYLHEVKIISDEIHQDFIEAGKNFVSSLEIAEKYKDNLFVLTSASKSFNLASLLHSHVIIPNETHRKNYDKVIETKVHNPVSLMGAIATEAAYTHGEEWLNGLNQVVDSNFLVMKSLFEENLPDAVVTNKEATYLAWIDLSAYLKDKNFVDVLENKAQVAIDYGEWFDKDSKGFIRMNLATSEENIIKAVTAISKSINN